MDEVLIDAGDFKPPGKVKFSPTSSFDAALEIAEAFGNIPWKVKEPTLKAEKSGRKQEGSQKAGFRFESARASVSSSHGFQYGGFEEEHLTTYAFGQYTASSTVVPPPRHSKKAATTANDAQDNDVVFSPIASSNTFGSLPVSPAGFGTTASPFVPYFMPINGPSASNRTSHVSGFGCSNEAIARLPGRSRGRGRRANTERQRGNKTAEQANTEVGTSGFSLPVSSGNGNNNNVKQTLKQMIDEPCTQSSPIGGRRASAFGEEIPSKRRCGVVCTICGKPGHSCFDCYSNPRNQTSREGIRCYNCNGFGHMAVRCTKPPAKPRNRRVSSSKSGRRKASTTENGQKGSTAARGKNVPSDLKGLEVICKLMKDKHLREEAAKKTPQLFDEMLTYMIDQLNLF